MTFKQIVLRALSTLGWTTLGYLIIMIPLWILIFVLAFAFAAGQDTGSWS